ncbi:MAG: ParB/RepB/Spo0J family partition protein [Candidatus Sericytochromatia bacterium]|nr:ParB/RepB/Spo0J family partition protein [Candidatus Sericytochromatia bacterium]
MGEGGTWEQLLNVTQARLGGAGDRRKLPLEKLVPNPDQPRRFFDAAALDELAASITVHGLLQPILVRPHPREAGRWQIVAGERRWLAAGAAGLVEVPVVVRELDDRTALELGLVENVLREDITPLEEARALKGLLDATGWSYTQLGERLGKNKAWVDHRVRLLKMPTVVQEALERQVATPEGKLLRPFSPRHAGVVVQAPEAEQTTLIEAVIADGLSVAELDRRLKAMQAPSTPQDLAANGCEVAPEPMAGVPARRRGRQRAAARAPRVAIANLRVHTLLAAAAAGDGMVGVQELLAAMEADRSNLVKA